MCVSKRIHMCDVMHRYVRWESIHVCVVTCLGVVVCLHMFEDTSMSMYDTYIFMCASWLVHTCHIRHSYVWRHIHVCVMTYLCHDMCVMTCVCHDPFKCVTWLICVCAMTHSYVWYDAFMCVFLCVRVCHDPFAWLHGRLVERERQRDRETDSET